MTTKISNGKLLANTLLKSGAIIFSVVAFFKANQILGLLALAGWCQYLVITLFEKPVKKEDGANG